MVCLWCLAAGADATVAMSSALPANGDSPTAAAIASSPFITNDSMPQQQQNHYPPAAAASTSIPGLPNISSPIGAAPAAAVAAPLQPSGGSGFLGGPMPAGMTTVINPLGQAMSVPGPSAAPPAGKL